MGKRRISGILKYGTRAVTSKVQMMQQGAQFAAVGKAYDWREDEYEVALMRQKIRNEDAGLANRYKGSKGSKGSRSNNNSNKDLASFSGGLQGARESANIDFINMQEKLLESAGASGVSDLTSGQYNNVVYFYDTVDGRLKDQEKLFTEAKGALTDEDMDALAISDNGIMFVGKIKNNAIVERLAITQEAYLKNMEQYKPLTVKDFAQWKQITSKNLDTQDIKMFMISGSMGPKKLKERFIDPLKNTIKITVKGNSVSIGSGGGTTVLSTISTFDKINNSTNPERDLDPATKANRDSVRTALDVVYNEMLAGKADKKRFENSVEAEILKYNAIRSRIADAGGVEERKLQLEKEKKRYVLNLLFELKGATVSRSSTDGDGDGGFNPGKTAGDPLIAGMTQIYSNSTISKDSFSSYDQEENTAKHKSNVSIFHAITVENTVPKSELNTAYNKSSATDEQKDQSYFGVNDKVNELSPLSGGVYTTEGLDLNTAFDPSFLTKFAVLQQNADAGTSWLPTKGGKLATIEIINKFKTGGVAIKIFAAKAFLASKKASGVTYNTTAEKMARNDNGGKVMTDFAKWLYDGTQSSEYQAKYNKDKDTFRDKKRESDEALEVLKKVRDEYDRLLGNDYTLQPYFKYKITVSDKYHNGRIDLAELEEAYENIGGNFGVFKKASGDDIAYAEDTLKMDNLWFSTYYNLDVYVLAKGTALSGKGDEKMNSVVNRVNAYNEGAGLLNQGSILGRRSVGNIITTLTNKSN